MSITVIFIIITVVFILISVPLTIYFVFFNPKTKALIKKRFQKIKDFLHIK